MIETYLCHLRTTDPVEGFQWRSSYTASIVDELPDWLNRKEYNLHVTGGFLHITVPNGAGIQTLIIRPGDFVLQAPDGKPMAVRESLFRLIGGFVARNPANVLAGEPMESFVIVNSANA